MSNRMNRRHTGSGLKRQFSMKTDDYQTIDRIPIDYYDTRFSSTHRLNIKQQSLQSRDNSAFIEAPLRKPLDYHQIPNVVGSNNRIMSNIITANTTSITTASNNNYPTNYNTTTTTTTTNNNNNNNNSNNDYVNFGPNRYLMVINPSLSAHSSLVAMSRVSQQPSFESYDSSMSTTSWASSNDPEVAYNQPRFIVDKRSISPSSNHSNNNKTSSNITMNTASCLIHPTLPTTENKPATSASDQHKKSPMESQSTKTGQMNKSMKQQNDSTSMRKKHPFLKSLTVDMHLLTKANSNLTKLIPQNLSKPNDKGKHTQRHQSNVHTTTNELADLKIIGMKKDTTSDLKTNTGFTGSQNMKGLWKRAFHSLHKDKNEREINQTKRKDGNNTPAYNENLEGEIDPVYHLLRCAASKSQTSTGPTTTHSSTSATLSSSSTTTTTNSASAKQNTKLKSVANDNSTTVSKNMMAHKTNKSVRSDSLRPNSTN